MENKLYIIALKNDVTTEEDIFVVQAKDKEEALRKYAKDYLIKDKTFKFILEDRNINSIYAEYFYKDIYDFDKSDGYTTNLTADEVNTKIKENIKSYLGEHQEYTDMLLNFYTDESKSVEELDYELLLILALKNIYEELECYLIKEVSL